MIKYKSSALLFMIISLVLSALFLTIGLTLLITPGPRILLSAGYSPGAGAIGSYAIAKMTKVASGITTGLLQVIRSYHC